LQAYREVTKSVSLDDKQDIVTSKLKELSGRVTQARSDRIRIEVELAQLRQLGENASALFVLPLVASDPTVVGIHTSVTKMENDFATLRQRYREKHPKYVQAATQLTDLRQSLTNAILKVPQSLAAAYESAKAAEQALDLALKDQETVALDLNKRAIQYNVLAREVQSDRILYDSVLNRLKETDLTKELESNKIRVVQPAIVPE